MIVVKSSKLIVTFLVLDVNNRSYVRNVMDALTPYFNFRTYISLTIKIGIYRYNLLRCSEMFFQNWWLGFLSYSEIRKNKYNNSFVYTDLASIYGKSKAR